MAYSKRPKKSGTKNPDIYDFDPLMTIILTSNSEKNSRPNAVSNPRNAREYYLRGLSFEKCGDHSRAIADYDKAISLDAGLAWAYYRRALLHGAEGNYALRSRDLQAAARLGLWMAVDMLALHSDTGTGSPM